MKIWCCACLFVTIFNFASFSNTSESNEYIAILDTTTSDTNLINNKFKNKSNFNDTTTIKSYVDRTIGDTINNNKNIETLEDFTLSTIEINKTKYTTSKFNDFLSTKYDHLTTENEELLTNEYTTISTIDELETTMQITDPTTTEYIKNYDFNTDLLTSNNYDELTTFSTMNETEIVTDFEKLPNTTIENENITVTENDSLITTESTLGINSENTKNNNLEVDEVNNSLSTTENIMISTIGINVTDELSTTDLTTMGETLSETSTIDVPFTVETKFENMDYESTIQNIYSTDNPTTDTTETSVSLNEDDLSKYDISSSYLTTTPQYYRRRVEINFGKYLEQAINAINNSEILESSSDMTSSTTEVENTSTTTQNPCEDEFITVKNVSIVAGYFSIFVNWIEPDELNCNFTYYLSWNDNECETNFTNYSIEELYACENYNISVGVIYNEKKKIPVIETITTKEIIKAVQLNSLVTNEENNTFLIYWTLPENIQKCLVKYHIEIFQNNKLITELDINVNNITFGNLDGCVNNTYLVSAHSKNYKSPKNSTYFLKLIENSPPINTLIQIEDDYVLTNWKYGQTICKPEQFFVSCEIENNTSFEQQGILNGNLLVAKIVDILPYNNYSCCGYIKNKETRSNCSEYVQFSTKSKAPSEVLNLQISEHEDQSLHVKWSPPKEWNGKAELYNVSLELIDLNYNWTENCAAPEKIKLSMQLKDNETEHNFGSVKAATKYKIGISAKSDGGWGNVTEEVFNTNEQSPQKPKIKSLHLQNWSVTSYNVTLNVSWSPPCEPNGELQNFTVQLIGYRDFDGTEHTLNDSVNATGEESYYLIFKDLKPEYNYSIILQAFVVNHSSEKEEGNVITPAGIPEIPENELMITPNTTSLKEPWKTAIVYITDNLFNNKMGKILYYAIIVAPEYCTENPKYEFYETNKWPAVSSDNSSCVNDTRAYQATDKYWNPFKITRRFKKETFTLGKNESCKEIDCNRPLHPSTKYFVKIRGFTKNGFSDTQLLSFKTEEQLNDVPVGLIAGLIVGILAIAFVIAVVLFYTKGKINFTNWPRMESSSSISPAPLPVSIKKFRTHYTKMIENPGKIKNEFQLLSTISSDVTLSTKTALLPVNRKKNRYINILPYDQTRVQLIDTTTNSSDFINASYIKGYSGTNEYIATQGPTESTCPAFWQMILEQNVKLIVMLTQFVESGKDKCYKYFPDLKEEYELINEIRVQCIEEELLPIYNRRTFKLLKGSTTKKVTHIQFNLWPDFGVPDEIHHMIDFCEIIKDIKMKKPSIIVMHCSAGVGRTGTLIAVDILMQTIRDKRKVDIFGTVLNLRKQRMNMVQSEKQYEFLYKCVNYVISENNSSSKNFLTQISESNML